MTSTRRTIPAPPPNGVSSTWPHFRGVEERGSTASTEWPRARAFSTWRCVRNQSNHWGNSVKTSAFTEKAQVDVDPAALEVDRADAVADHRHEQLGAVGTVDLEHLDAGERAHAPHEAHRDVGVEDRAALEVAGPELALREHLVRARDGELGAAQSERVVARRRALEAQDR